MMVAVHHAPIARKKKVVLQVSGGKDVVISSAGDDNKSMCKLFAANLKVATDEPKAIRML